MLNWSLNLLRVRGIQLAVHSSFFLLLAFVAWQGWWEVDPETGTPGEWVGLAWNVGILLAFFACVLLHELGHSFTALHFGIGVRRILLMPIGGMAEFDSIPRQPRRELLITIAGPAVNFVLATLLGLFAGFPLIWPWAEYGFAANLTGFAQLLAYLNLIMGVFNLAPVFPMDGGRILRASLAAKLPYLRATRIAALVARVIAVIGIPAALVIPPALGGRPMYMLAVLLAFILVAGELEYRAAERREREDAHWRETLARLYATATDTSDEPPRLHP